MSSGKCPYSGKTVPAPSSEDAAPATAKKCPFDHTRQAPKKCPVMHGQEESKKSSDEVDVHAMDAPQNASDAVRSHFEASYNAVAARASEKVTPERIGMARAIMSKLGYSEEDLDTIGEDVVLMQGVGNPHTWGAYGPGKKVLDIGCGFGVDTRLAATRVGPTGHAYGLDLSRGEVLAALSLNQKHGTKNVDFRIGDMEKLPFADNSLDCVVSNGGFCLVLDKRIAFGEIQRVLRPGGRIAIACTTKKTALESGVRWPVCMNTFMPIESIEPLLKDLGFEDIRVDTSNSLMNASDSIDDSDLAAAAKAAGTCTHAIKAQMRRRKAHGSEEAKDDEGPAPVKPTVHSGQAQFAHLKNFDMNELCARVVILATKAGAPKTCPFAGAAASSSSSSSSASSPPAASCPALPSSPAIAHLATAAAVVAAAGLGIRALLSRK